MRFSAIAKTLIAASIFAGSVFIGASISKNKNEIEKNRKNQTIAQIIGQDTMFRLLDRAITDAGLKDTLNRAKSLTLFAPTDSAFDRIPAGGKNLIFAAPQGILRAIVLYHVIPNSLSRDKITKMSRLATMQGDTLKISIVADTLVLNNSVKVIETDIKAANGTIHVIDHVLIPPAVKLP
jgi:uncharacterized surface protein with fasciclin (FAS1) repeats